MKIIGKLTLFLFVITGVSLLTSCKKDSENINNSSFVEGFQDVRGLILRGWAMKDNSNPLGVTWNQGKKIAVQAESGPETSFISSSGAPNSSSNSSSSSWLITPELTMKNGDQIVFYTVAIGGAIYYNHERLQVRRNTKNTGTFVGDTYSSVGDFTTLLYEINETELTNYYPEVWTKISVEITDLPTPTAGRIAFRYFLTQNNYYSFGIGIDSLAYISK